MIPVNAKSNKRVCFTKTAVKLQTSKEQFGSGYSLGLDVAILTVSELRIINLTTSVFLHFVSECDYFASTAISSRSSALCLVVCLSTTSSGQLLQSGLQLLLPCLS
jgi:hypothetical protein